MTHIIVTNKLFQSVNKCVNTCKKCGNVIQKIKSVKFEIWWRSTKNYSTLIAREQYSRTLILADLALCSAESSIAALWSVERESNVFLHSDCLRAIFLHYNQQIAIFLHYNQHRAIFLHSDQQKAKFLHYDLQRAIFLHSHMWQRTIFPYSDPQRAIFFYCWLFDCRISIISGS